MLKKTITLAAIALLASSAFAVDFAFGAGAKFDGMKNPSYTGGFISASTELLELDFGGFYTELYVGGGGATYYWETTFNDEATEHSKKDFGWNIGFKPLMEIDLLEWFSLRVGFDVGAIFYQDGNNGMGFGGEMGFLVGGVLWQYSIFSLWADVVPSIKFADDVTFALPVYAGVRVNWKNIKL